MAARTYQQVLTEALADFATNGYDSQERLDYWQKQLAEAAEASMMSAYEMESLMRASLTQIYKRLVDDGTVYQRHPGVSRFTVDRLRPAMRAELDRRILASADLIKLNRKQAIQKTLQRFSGWATSVPKGGSPRVNWRDEKRKIKKALSSLPFEERRVLIDQGHKLNAGINSVIAMGSGAIAAIWRSHKNQVGYDGRPDHNHRDGDVFAIRGNWAMEQGLMKRGPNGYTDEIEQPAEFVFCRCWYVYIYNLRDLPEVMITAKGKIELERVRGIAAAL